VLLFSKSVIVFDYNNHQIINPRPKFLAEDFHNFAFLIGILTFSAKGGSAFGGGL
jgi:hypothetical protein